MKTKKRKYKSKNITFKKDQCAANKNGSFTCFNKTSLNKLKKYWNLRHPDVPINQTSPKKIWIELKTNMSGLCKRESCWLNQEFIKHNLDTELLNYTFAPKQPKTWKSNPKEWLNSIDISKVMRQFEKKHPEFQFLGPSPIDFDHRKMGNQCVWPEICTLNLVDKVKTNKNKIGMIFNLDPHYKSGSHWVAYFVNVPKKKTIYWDSTGEDCPGEILSLNEKIHKQGKQININFEFTENKIKHQKLNTECGIYCIYFLDKMINSDEPKLFDRAISDSEIFKYRNIYFNEL